MADISQLIKKNPQASYEKVFPKTYVDNIVDKATGLSLYEILAGFNMYYLPYAGSDENTRLLVVSSLRKTGLWITYVKYDNTVVVEWYGGTDISDSAWMDDSNWRDGSNMLVGDISISSEGNWIVDGTDTGVSAQGEQGITPVLRVYNNRLQVSYNEGVSFEDVSDNPIYYYFRVYNNKLQISSDLGETWTDVSEELAWRFKVEDNVLKMSKDLGSTWETVSDYIAAWFRWYSDSYDSQGYELGKIQISRDEGTTWSDLSSTFTNNLHISGYVSAVSELPATDVAIGTIYGVGPTYSEGDTEQENPIYRIYVYTDEGWIDNGQFTSIAAGVVQELGDSETEVVSQIEVSNLYYKLFAFCQSIGVNLGTEVKLELSGIYASSQYGKISMSELTYNSFILKVNPGEVYSITGYSGIVIRICAFTEAPYLGLPVDFNELEQIEFIGGTFTIPDGIYYIMIDTTSETYSDVEGTVKVYLADKVLRQSDWSSITYTSLTIDDKLSTGIYFKTSSNAAVLWVSERDDGTVLQIELGTLGQSSEYANLRYRIYSDSSWGSWNAIYIDELIEGASLAKTLNINPYTNRDSCLTTGTFSNNGGSNAGILLAGENTVDGHIYQLELLSLMQQSNSDRAFAIRTRRTVSESDGSYEWDSWNTIYIDELIDKINNLGESASGDGSTSQTGYPKGILKYTAEDNQFEFFSYRGVDNQYFSFVVKLDSDTSDSLYLHEWRLYEGGLYTYTDGTFVKLGDTIITGENECPVGFTGWSDYVGGYHGDERIDIDDSCYVKFFAGGQLITEDELDSDFTKECVSFSYIQYSTLHEPYFVNSSHDIIAHHVKYNMFEDCSSYFENTVIFDSDSYSYDDLKLMTLWSIIFCTGKYAANEAVAGNGVYVLGNLGTDVETNVNSDNCKAIEWNSDNGIKVELEGHFTLGLPDCPDSLVSGELNNIVRDRYGDTKIYRKWEGMSLDINKGDIFKTSQKVKFI